MFWTVPYEQIAATAINAGYPVDYCCPRCEALWASKALGEECWACGRPGRPGALYQWCEHYRSPRTCPYCALRRRSRESRKITPTVEGGAR